MHLGLPVAGLATALGLYTFGVGLPASAPSAQHCHCHFDGGVGPASSEAPLAAASRGPLLAIVIALFVGVAFGFVAGFCLAGSAWAAWSSVSSWGRPGVRDALPDVFPPIRAIRRA